MKRSKSQKKGNKKRSWGKNIDITDVEGFLDDQRLEQELGGPFSEKTNESLFEICNTPMDIDGSSQNIKKKPEQQKKKAIFHSNKEEIPLKCFQTLLPISLIRKPVSKSQRRKTRTKLRTLGNIAKASRRNIIKAARLIIQQDKQQEQLQTANLTARKPTKDIWAEEDKVTNEWIPWETMIHNVANTEESKVNVPAHLLKKTSEISAIELPHPGTSYNPSYEDHQLILKKARETEGEKMEEENKTLRKVNAGIVKINPQEKQKIWVSEMLEGLPQQKRKVDSDEESSDDNSYISADDAEIVQTKTLVRSDLRKTRHQRRKEKILKDQLKRKQKKKEEVKKLNDVYRLKKIVKDIKLKEGLTSIRLKRREKKKELKPFQTRTLGKHRYEEPDILYNFPDELHGSLRTLKMEGSILAERYNSLQMRNKLEPRVRIWLKKQKKKLFLKKGYNRLPYEGGEIV